LQEGNRGQKGPGGRGGRQKSTVSNKINGLKSKSLREGRRIGGSVGMMNKKTRVRRGKGATAGGRDHKILKGGFRKRGGFWRGDEAEKKRKRGKKTAQ